jgi:hypothetical protein
MNQAVKSISTACRSTEKTVVLNSSLREALASVRDLVLHSKPLEISRSICKTWTVFTDGAFEPGTDHPATVGGVLISPSGVALQCFGEYLNETLVGELLIESKHPIYELEVLPLLLATQAWSHFISGSPVVYFWIMMQHDRHTSKALELPILPEASPKNLYALKAP